MQQELSVNSCKLPEASENVRVNYAEPIDVARVWQNHFVRLNV